MATSTLIQKLDATALVTSTTVPGGYQTVTTPDVSNRRQVETFIAGATVVVGQWVQFDTSKSGAVKVLTVVPAAITADGNALVVGVVLGSAETSGALTAGSKINVIVSGYASVAAVTTGVAAGTPLVVDATLGRADARVAGDISDACGVALTLAGSNLAEVWVYKKF